MSLVLTKGIISHKKRWIMVNEWSNTFASILYIHFISSRIFSLLFKVVLIVFACIILFLFTSKIYTGGNSEIYKNVFLSGDAKTASIDRTVLSTSHPVRAISNTSEDEMSLLGAESSVELINDNRKQSLVNMTTQASLNNIIDDCFFGDDALNCNVVLVHSPFSSDNDVDGFTMTNENGGCVMNKELLNKFHDRLEEMEEKVDSNDFKTIWDHVLDEASDLNDDICTDDIDESAVA